MFKKKRNLLLTIVLIGLLFSCSSGDKKVADQTQATPTESKASEPQGGGQASVAAVEGEEKNALQVAKSIPDFSTLVTAIEAAGVQDAVVNAGPLTIFAPLNSAFDKLPKGTVATLLKPENKKKLSFILTNHVAPANYSIKTLKKAAKKGRKLYMASGKYLLVENRADGVYVGGTKILKSVKVSNGWIYVIGDVLVPTEDK